MEPTWALSFLMAGTNGGNVLIVSTGHLFPHRSATRWESKHASLTTQVTAISIKHQRHLLRNGRTWACAQKHTSKVGDIAKFILLQRLSIAWMTKPSAYCRMVPRIRLHHLLHHHPLHR